MPSRSSRHLRHLAILIVLLSTIGILVGIAGVSFSTAGLPLGATAACGCEAVQVVKVSPKTYKFTEEPKAGQAALVHALFQFTNEGPGKFNLEGVLFTYSEGASGSFTPINSLNEPCENVVVGEKCELFVEFRPKAGNQNLWQL